MNLSVTERLRASGGGGGSGGGVSINLYVIHHISNFNY